MDSLIIKSPFLVATVATLGGVSMLQSALGAGVAGLRENCYIIPGLTVTQCSIELSIYTSLCFLFAASVHSSCLVATSVHTDLCLLLATSVHSGLCVFPRQSIQVYVFFFDIVKDTLLYVLIFSECMISIKMLQVVFQ